MAKVKKNKAKKKKLSDKVKPIIKKKVMNPFEVHINRQKFDVLGRKTKNDRGLPGVARSKAIKKRKGTLLQEYKVKDKSNQFLDRRIGERNRAMTSEDRMMARFTAERMKVHNKKQIFNLADDEILTHRGQRLTDIEKFDDPRSDDEDERDKLGADFVEDAHFGGGIFKKSENSETSRKNLIDQLIAESKKRKAEQQKAREQTIELTEKLDTEWKDLLPIVNASKNTQGIEINDEKPDSYDIAMRQLKFEARGKPSDKLKSEDELAKEEKERLEKLEAERLQRMHGVKNLVPEKKHRSADDLDDGFDLESDEEAMLTYDADGQLKDPHFQSDVDDEETGVENKSAEGEVSDGNSEDEEKNDVDEKDEDDDDDDSSSSSGGDDNDNLSDLKLESDSDEEETVKNKSQKDTNSEKKHEDWKEKMAESGSDKEETVKKKPNKDANSTKKQQDRKEKMEESESDKEETVKKKSKKGTNSTKKHPQDKKEKMAESENDKEETVKRKSKKDANSTKKHHQERKEKMAESESDKEETVKRKSKKDANSTKKHPQERKEKMAESESDKEETVKRKSIKDANSTKKHPQERKEKMAESESDEEETGKEKSGKDDAHWLSGKEKMETTAESDKEEIEVEPNTEKEEKANKLKADLLARKEMMEQARKELPYTFKVPESYEELQTLLNGRSYEHQAVIIERMIKCNHPSLGAGLKDKLANLFAFLLQHLQDTATFCRRNDAHNCFTLLDHIVPHLYDLCHMSPENAGHCMSEVIKEKQQDFRLRRQSFPSFATLMFLKLVSLLFPTSDFRHPVVTPALVFMCQMLNQCRVKTPQDVAMGLFLTTLVLEYTELSKRFSPSAINFLHGILDMAVPRKDERLFRAVHPIYIAATARNLLVPEETVENTTEIGSMTLDDLRGKNLGKNFKLRVFKTALELLKEFCENLKPYSASYGIFQPVLNTLKKIDMKVYPTSIVDVMNDVISSIEAMAQQKLQLIVVEKKRPKALRLYEPRIEAVLDERKRRTGGKQRQEREKLLHKYKKEMKGAVREIRRDKSFLANVKFKQTMREDIERKRKVKEIFGSAAIQQGELAKLQRQKKH